MITLSGIKNCDSVKKARKWLDAHTVEYHFHDLRGEGLTLSQLEEWKQRVGWELLLNRRGTSWRQLPQEVKDGIDEGTALALMLETPTLIKRPVLQLDDGSVHVGFNEELYQKLFC